MMKAIVAVDEYYGIGKDGNLLFRISDDLKRFKKLTEGRAVIMGRRTLESLPGGKPLPDRINFVLTQNKEYNQLGIIPIHSLDEIQEIFQTLRSDKIFVIGGASVYAQLLPHCDTVYMTKVYKHEIADAIFPDLPNDEWNLVSKSDRLTDEKTGLVFRYLVYERSPNFTDNWDFQLCKNRFSVDSSTGIPVSKKEDCVQ